MDMQKNEVVKILQHSFRSSFTAGRQNCLAHARADLVLRFVPDCKLVNANRRYHLVA